MIMKKINEKAVSVLFIIICAVSQNSIADNAITTKSIYYQGTALDETKKTQLFKQAKSQSYAALVKQGYRNESTDIVMAARYTSSDVEIYNADTLLISDFNNNGFYHRFSVTFDADTLYPTAELYAKLYISYEGGPWNLFNITEYFSIESDSEFDLYTVETELSDGFYPGYYDIKIELFDAHNDYFITAYGPYQDNSLAALPLEDSYYDDSYDGVIATPVQTEVIIAASGHGHGALGIGILLAPLIALMRRLRS
jgi:hypothetical protein